jgi:hypothetical protein
MWAIIICLGVSLIVYIVVPIVVSKN